MKALTSQPLPKHLCTRHLAAETRSDGLYLTIGASGYESYVAGYDDDIPF